jgi:hypothetical protein
VSVRGTLLETAGPQELIMSTIRSLCVVLLAVAACGNSKSNPGDGSAGLPPDSRGQTTGDPVKDQAARMVDEGRQTFRFDTFGDEAFWGGTLRLHEAIATVSPKTALGVGLKVDLDALPSDLQQQLSEGKVNLDDPATTLALLKLNAVVGVTGFFSGDQLTSVGIQCAFCHSTVDSAFAPGVGHRLDGWPNRDLNVGAIVGLAPDLSAFATVLGTSQDTVRQVLASWGPGKFDAELILDGKAFRPDGKTAATLIPPAFGQAGVPLHTYGGWGSTPHWNAFVAVLEMHGKGNFYDPRLDDATQFPVAARNKFGHVTTDDDRVSAKLPGLHFYQLALVPPQPKGGTFDADAAERGDKLFEGKAKCASCHVEGTYAEPGWPMHTAAEIGIDDFQAKRAPDGMYRTTPLHGLSAHMTGGFYHDGRFATLGDVVEHYNSFMRLGLSDTEKADLVEYLKSL